MFLFYNDIFYAVCVHFMFLLLSTFEHISYMKRVLYKFGIIIIIIKVNMCCNRYLLHCPGV